MRRLEDSQEPIVFKIDDLIDAGDARAESVDPDPGGVALRVDVRSLSGMQKEAIVSGPSAGAVWRLACDEGPYLNGTDLAPFPLGFFAAGLQFSFLTELLGHARREGVRISSLSAVQDTRYTMSGSAIRGDMEGGALPSEVQISVDADVAPDRMATLIALAQATSPAEAVMRDLLANTFALTLNGHRVEPGSLRSSARTEVADPAGIFDRIRPTWAGSLPRDIVTKTSEADKAHGVEGGVASSLQSEQKRTLHIRAAARLLDDDLIETVLTLFKPIGSTFRFLCDARPGVDMHGRTPSGPAYLAAGIAFCFMTQLGRYAHIVKQQVHSTRLSQFNLFHRSGPEGLAAAAPVDTHLFVDADESDDAIRRLALMGEQTCFLHAAMRSQLPTTWRAQPTERS